MKEIDISKSFETMYYDKLDNGLELYLLPNKKAKGYYITLNIKFGSIDTEFSINKKNYKVPNGVAHFLEHLMFNEPDGTTAHEMFAKLGSACNAATSFDFTYYEVYSTNKFKENLEYLLDYVYRPYFTNKLVKNEKGIIIEEVKMGENSPYRELYFKSKENVFFKNPYKNLISGTVDDVKNITLKDIELCYNTFYHPENMFIVITGNFNPYEARAMISENLSRKKFKKFNKAIRKVFKEPKEVVKAYDEKEMNILIPKATINIKMNTNDFKIKGIDKLKLLLYLNIFLSLKFGKTSLLSEKLINNNLLTDDITSGVQIDPVNTLISISFESLYSKEVLELIKEEFNDTKISLKDLKRKVKRNISNKILNFDDIFSANDDIQTQLFQFNNYYENIIDIYNSLNLKELDSIIKKISLKNNSVLIINPMQKDS